MSILWFLSSLIPLSVCTAIMYWDVKYIRIASCVVIVIGVLFFISLYIYISKRKKTISVKGHKTLVDIHVNRHIPIDFLFAYVLPLIAFNLHDCKQAICFLLILSVYFVLYWRNRTYHVNVILYLFGYKAYNCKDENDREVLVIAKKGWNSFSRSEVKCFSLGGEDNWFVIQHLPSNF